MQQYTKEMATNLSTTTTNSTTHNQIESSEGEAEAETEKWYYGTSLMRGRRYSWNVDYNGKPWIWEVTFIFKGYAATDRFNEGCSAIFPAPPDKRMALAALPIGKDMLSEDLPENLKGSALFEAMMEMPCDGNEREGFEIFQDAEGNDMRLIKNGGLLWTGEHQWSSWS